jgi:single-strand DNA-binding protein
MAFNMNSVKIAGNMARDIEIRYTASGMAVGDTAVAVNRRYKGKDGEYQEEVVFIPVTMWGKDAENAAAYLTKGSTVLIEGRLSMDEWDDKDSGKKRSKLFVTAERVHYGAKQDNQQGGNDRQQYQRRDNPPQGRGYTDADAGKPGNGGGGAFDKDADVDNIPFRHREFDSGDIIH